MKQSLIKNSIEIYITKRTKSLPTLSVKTVDTLPPGKMFHEISADLR